MKKILLFFQNKIVTYATRTEKNFNIVQLSKPDIRDK